MEKVDKAASIDILFSGDDKSILEELSKYTVKSYEKDKETFYDDACTNLMEQIENDNYLYEYFKKSKDKNIDVYIWLLTFTQNHSEDIYEAIENMDSEVRSELIEKLNPEKALEYLQNISNDIDKTIEDIDTNKKKITFSSSETAELIIVICKADSKQWDTYLTLEKAKEFGLNNYDISYLIMERCQADPEQWDTYLRPEKTKEFGLNGSNIRFLINERCKADPKQWDIYLTPEKVKEFGLNNYDISYLIMERCQANPEQWDTYLTPEKVKEFGLANYDIERLIKIRCQSDPKQWDYYLTPEKAKEFGFNDYILKSLIKATGKVKDFLLPEQAEGELLNISNLIYYACKGRPEQWDIYLTPEKTKELGIEDYRIDKLIRATGKVKDFLLPEQAEGELLNISNLIYYACKGRPEQWDIYLTPEKTKEYGLTDYDIVGLIMARCKDDQKQWDTYLTLEKVKEFGFDDYCINKLIKATDKVKDFLFPGQTEEDYLHIDNFIYYECKGRLEQLDTYLTSEKVKEFGLESYIIERLIIARCKADQKQWDTYLTPEKVKEFGLESYIIERLIIARCKVDPKQWDTYLTLEKVKEFELEDYYIDRLIEATGKVADFFLPGQTEDYNFINNFYFNINNLYWYSKKEKFTEDDSKRLKSMLKKNGSLYSTINFDCFLKRKKFNFTDEQLIRITNYPNVQEYILRNNSTLMGKTIKYIMEKADNWVISLDKIIKLEAIYKDLMDNLIDIDNDKITEEIIQNFICIILDQNNYFNIQNYEDVLNYSTKKNTLCLDILKGTLEKRPEGLDAYNEDELYKFALLEYKFGISLDEAKRLIKRYGTDSDKLPKGVIVADYIRLLKTIIEHDNIKDVIDYALKNNLLENPWTGFPNAINAEGQILNMFEKLYNDTLYNPEEQDRLGTETYIDGNGEHEIEIYQINRDFNMNVRVEGAYRRYHEPDDFNKYFENPSISNHGNCESYIGNDIIATARNSTTGSIIVGYKSIYHNSLTSCGPYDLGTGNTTFSIYNERSDFRIPIEMKNNTRHTHNEMVKERLIIDENGYVVKNKPSYIVWIEEDSKATRGTTGWKEKREKDPKWIVAKKAAAQLGIPIVIIDREYFLQRETDKISVMKKLITGEEIDEEKYEEYIKEYGNLSKAELIEQIIIKFENNRVGLQFNDELKRNIFYTITIRRINKSDI